MVLVCQVVDHSLMEQTVLQPIGKFSLHVEIQMYTYNENCDLLGYSGANLGLGRLGSCLGR